MWVKDLAQTNGIKTRAYRNANRLVEFERSLHLFIEPNLQNLFMNSTLLIRFLNLYYTTMHFAVTSGVLLWLYVRHQQRYGRMRTILLLSSTLALIAYFAFPLLPPRLYPCDCLVDTLDVVGGSWSYYSNQIKHLANPYAAMPSVHFSWALWSGIALWRYGRHRVTRVIGVVHPMLTGFAIVATANHYWLDAVGGAIVLALAAWLVTAGSHWRNQRSTTADATTVDKLGGVVSR